MNIRIRPVTEADIDAVYRIEQDVHIVPWSKKIISDCYWVGYDFKVLQVDQDIIGYIIVRCCYNMAHILNLCIARSFQHMGYGRLLLENTLEKYKNSEGIDYIILEVRPSNKTAISLYRSLNFDTLEIKKNYYNVGEHQEDAIVLRKILI